MNIAMALFDLAETRTAQSQVNLSEVPSHLTWNMTIVGLDLTWITCIRHCDKCMFASLGVWVFKEEIKAAFTLQ